MACLCMSETFVCFSVSSFREVTWRTLPSAFGCFSPYLVLRVVYRDFPFLRVSLAHSLSHFMVSLYRSRSLTTVTSLAALNWSIQGFSPQMTNDSMRSACLSTTSTLEDVKGLEKSSDFSPSSEEQLVFVCQSLQPRAVSSWRQTPVSSSRLLPPSCWSANFAGMQVHKDIPRGKRRDFPLSPCLSPGFLFAISDVFLSPLTVQHSPPPPFSPVLLSLPELLWNPLQEAAVRLCQLWQRSNSERLKRPLCGNPGNNWMLPYKFH